MEVSRELWEFGSFREDDALNIAAFQLTTGERKSQEEIERILGDPVNPNDKELYERYCENFELVVKARDELRLMGSLPYFQPGALPLREDHGKREGVSRRKKYALSILVPLSIATLLGAYLNYVYIPQHKKLNA